jgi:hypothetical protein
MGSIFAELKGRKDAKSGRLIRNTIASAMTFRILSQRIRETKLERQMEYCRDKPKSLREKESSSSPHSTMRPGVLTRPPNPGLKSETWATTVKGAGAKARDLFEPQMARLRGSGKSPF